MIQLEPQASSATEACAYILITSEKSTQKLRQLASASFAMAENERAPHDIAIWIIFGKCFESIVVISGGDPVPLPSLSRQMSESMSPSSDVNSLSNSIIEESDLSTPIQYTQPHEVLLQATDNFASKKTATLALECLLESLSFCYGACLQSSRLNMDRVRSVRTSSNDKVDGAYFLIREWSNTRNIRHSMIAHQLVATVQDLRNEHTRLKDVWQEALADLGRIATHIIPDPVKNSSAVSSSSSLLPGEGLRELLNHEMLNINNHYENVMQRYHEAEAVLQTRKKEYSTSPFLPEDINTSLKREGSDPTDIISEDGKCVTNEAAEDNLDDNAPVMTSNPISWITSALSSNIISMGWGIGTKVVSEEASQSQQLLEENDQRQEMLDDPESGESEDEEYETTLLQPNPIISVDRRGYCNTATGRSTAGKAKIKSSARRRPKVSTAIGSLPNSDATGDIFSEEISPITISHLPMKGTKKENNSYLDILNETESDQTVNKAPSRRSSKTTANITENKTNKITSLGLSHHNSSMSTGGHLSDSSSDSDAEVRWDGEEERTSESLPANELAVGWEEVRTPDGAVYYYHTVTRVSRWDRPDRKIVEAMDARLQESQEQVNAAVQRRKLEREQGRLKEQKKTQLAEEMRETVKSIINNWKQPNGKNILSLGELLQTLPNILPDVVPVGAICSPSNPLSSSSLPSDVKKAYMKAVRFIHPDKLSASVTNETKILAEAIFVFLSSVYEVYRNNNL